MRLVRKLSFAAITPLLALALAGAFSPVSPTVEAAGEHVVSPVETTVCQLETLLEKATSLFSWAGPTASRCA